MYASLGQSGSLFIDLAIQQDDQIHSSSFSACTAGVSGGGLFISSTGRTNTLEVKNAAFDSSCTAPEGGYIMIDCTDISNLLEGKIDNWEGTIDNTIVNEKEKFWVREKSDSVETLSISLIDFFYPAVPSVQSSESSSSQQSEPAPSHSSRQSRSESSSSSSSFSPGVTTIIVLLVIAIIGILILLFCVFSRRLCYKLKGTSTQAVSEDRAMSDLPLIQEEEDILTGDTVYSTDSSSFRAPTYRSTQDNFSDVAETSKEEEGENGDEENPILQNPFSETGNDAALDYE